MYTRSSSGVQQDPLFYWLTHVSQNEHFNIDVSGPSTKFMIRSSGELFGVLGTRSRIGGSVINRMIQTQ
jgi:hypothetical protein